MSGDRILAALGPVGAVLDRLGIRWHIGGSVASATFGVARSTLDVDLAADVEERHAEPIVDALRGDYYVDEELIREAVRRRSCFNLIYLPAFYKVDVFVPDDSPYERAAILRSVHGVLTAGGQSATFPFAAPEDVVLHKLDWWRRAGGSDRQWTDLVGLLRVQRGSLDLAYLEHWAAHLQLGDLLGQALQQAG